MTDIRDADELFEGPDKPKPDGTEKFLDKRQSNSDPKRLKEKAVSAKARDLQDENDLKAILSSEAGVRFMVKLFNRCGIDQPAFHPSNSMMCEIAGRRQIANDLREWIKNCGLEYWFAVEREFETRRPKPQTSERSR